MLRRLSRGRLRFAVGILVACTGLFTLRVSLPVHVDVDLELDDGDLREPSGSRGNSDGRRRPLPKRMNPDPALRPPELEDDVLGRQDPNVELKLKLTPSAKFCPREEFAGWASAVFKPPDPEEVAKWNRFQPVKEGQPTVPVHFVFQEAFRSDLVTVHLESLRLNLKEEFKYHLCDGSTPGSRLERELGRLGDGKTVFYHRFPQTAMGDALDIAFRSIVKFLERGLVVIIHTDNFLIRPWSAFQYWLEVGNPDIAGWLEFHSAGVLPYPSPNFFVFNRTTIQDPEQMTFQARYAGTHGDIGTKIAQYLGYHPSLKYHAVLTSYFINLTSLVEAGLMSQAEMKLIKFQQKNGHFAALKFTKDFVWLHLRDGSNWSGREKGGGYQGQLLRMVKALVRRDKSREKIKVTADPAHIRELLISHRGTYSPMAEVVLYPSERDLQSWCQLPRCPNWAESKHHRSMKTLTYLRRL